MRKSSPIFDRETVLANITRAGRRGQPFVPIQAFDMPVDEYRSPAVGPATSPTALSPCVAGLKTNKNPSLQ